MGMGREIQEEERVHFWGKNLGERPNAQYIELKMLIYGLGNNILTISEV